MVGPAAHLLATTIHVSPAKNVCARPSQILQSFIVWWHQLEVQNLTIWIRSEYAQGSWDLVPLVAAPRRGLPQSEGLCFYGHHPPVMYGERGIASPHWSLPSEGGKAGGT